MKFSTSIALLACVSTSLAFAPTAFQRKSTSLFASDGILTKKTGMSSMDPAVVDKYNALAYPDDVILAEYVWVDSAGSCRSKTRTLPSAKVCKNDEIFFRQTLKRVIFAFANAEFSFFSFIHFRARKSRTYPSGTSMVAPLARPLVTILRSSSALAASSRIPSVPATTESATSW
jgi:hypothetical protein